MVIGILAPLVFGPSGYARACRDILFNLDDLNVTVRLYGLNLPGYDGIVSREAYKRLQGFAREQGEPDVFLNVAPQCYFIRTSKTYTVGMTMWEGLEHPKRFASACRIVDEIWVPGVHDFLSFQKYSTVSEERIALMPLGIDTDLFSPTGPRFSVKSEDGEEFDFTFGVVCGYSSRKGVDLLERAFLERFDASESVTLLIKSDSNAARLIGADLIAAQQGLPQSSLPLILYHFDPITDAEMPQVFRALDCFAFPSRGEGQGLPPLEAMATGLPTIVTNATGLADFAFEEICFPIPSAGWRADPNARWVTGEYKETRFAIPDYQELCNVMRFIYEHPEEAAGRGRRAREFVLRNRTCRILVSRMLHRFEQILHGRTSTADFGPATLTVDCPNVYFDGSRFIYKS